MTLHLLWILLLLCCVRDTDSQSYGNVSFAIPPAVRLVHSLPRISSSLREGSKEFQLDHSNWMTKSEYTSSLAVFPTLLAVILFTIMTIRLCYWMYWRPSCDVDGDIKQQIKQNMLLKQRQYYLYISLILFLLGCHALFFVKSCAQDGKHTSDLATDSLYSTAMDLKTGGELLDLSGDNTFALIQQSQAACPEAAAMLVFQVPFQTSVASFLDVISPIPDDITEFQVFLKDWGDEVMNDITWILYLASWLVTVPILVSQLAKNNVALYISIAFGFIVVLGLLVSWCIFLIGLVRYTLTNSTINNLYIM